MSDLDQSLELIASFFAAVVILLILLIWLEATMSTDREIRCDVYPARPGMGECACRRGRSGRVRP
jgi:hypothetical protein